MTEDKKLKDMFPEVPPFLKILNLIEAYPKDKQYYCLFEPTKELTHTNGKIVQGGFVAGMLDNCMAQQLIYISNGKKIPLTLDIDVKFFEICSPAKVEVYSSIAKEGKSIIFTEAKLYQNNKLIASATATNKMISI